LTDLILERVLFYFSIYVAFVKLKCLARILGIVSELVKSFLDGEYVLCGRHGNQGMVERGRREGEFAKVSGFFSSTYRSKTSEKWHCF
jgi:hypothetical protein